MLDIKFVRNNPRSKQNIKNKFQDDKLPIGDAGYRIGPEKPGLNRK